MKTRLIIYIAIGAAILVVMNLRHPVNSGIMRYSLVACAACIWICCVILAWTRKRWRISILMFPILLAIPFVLPGRDIDPDELRSDYVKRLKGFEGTKYIWGGESSGGIDCSGLPRRALRDALFSYGFRHLNGRAFRMYAENWWFDSSAKALGEGYRDYTVPVAVDGTIQEMSYSDLLPGDLAVTKSGMHVLTYAGGNRWIQSAPEVGSVCILDGRDDYNGWFTVPVAAYRWSVLSE